MIALAHIRAMILRHWYILRHSPPYVINIMCWPVMNILVWGFMNHHMTQMYGGSQASAHYVGGTLIIGAMFWDIFIRASWGFTGSIDEEFQSRNLGAMMASPMNMGSYIAGCAVVSFVKGVVAFLPVPFLVWGVFGFSVFSLSWHLLPYIAILLVFGWAFGLLVASLLFIWGHRAESLCWFTPMILCSLMAPYYPVASLPESVQAVSLMMPATYVFEAMRADMAGLPIDWSFFPKALALSIAWFALAVYTFTRAVARARNEGRLLSADD